MGQDGAKLEPRWSQDGPGWSQDGSRWSQDGPRWSQEGPRWSQEGANKPAPEQEECTVARVTAAAILHALNVTDQEQHDARRGFLGMSCAELVTLMSTRPQPARPPPARPPAALRPPARLYIQTPDQPLLRPHIIYYILYIIYCILYIIYYILYIIYYILDLIY